MKRILIFLVIYCATASVYALSRWNFFCYDNYDRLQIGTRVGAAMSSVSNVEPMLEKAEGTPDYSWDKKAFVRPTASLFSEYKFFKAAAEVECSYYIQGSRLKEHKAREDAEYSITSQFVGIGLNLRLYCTDLFYIGAAGRYSFNMSNDMRFSSNKFTRYDDYEGRVRKQMEESFEPGNEVAAGLLLGYTFKNGLQLEGRCMFGLSDLIRTHVNDYDYTEQNNNTLWIGLTVGYPIVIFKR